MNVKFPRSIPTCIATVLLTLTAVAAHAQNDISVSLNTETTNLKGSDDVTVGVTITNVSSEPVQVPKRYLPSRLATSGVFTVTRDGMPVPYLGALVKRGAFTAKDFVKIAAGGSLNFKVELSSLYDLSASGVYSVQYDVQSVPTLRGRSTVTSAVDGTGERVAASSQLQDLASNVVALTIIGDPELDAQRAVDAASTLANDAIAPAYAASVSFVGCSNTRTSQIRTALTSAETYASNSLSYLNAGTRGARYTTWFGTYSSGRYSTVRSHFSSISNAVSTKPMVFDCSTCPGTEYSNAYAYVYPNQPYRVYLCGSFWAAPNTGTDSRAGTIIHEVSHFTVVADTDDLAYGQTAARNLARSNPSRAVRNADSHEYFSENTPYQN
ncbi:MAG TPA: M35 family metallo-endopeptidase [Povalibacter sp.]